MAGELASTPAGEGWGYSGPAIAAAVLATVFFPLIALIAALVMLGGQQDPLKRRSLRNWAWASAAWLVVPAVIVIALWTSGSSSSRVDPSGPCVGGPRMGVEGNDVSGNGTKFALPCSISGTTTISLPNKSH